MSDQQPVFSKPRIVTEADLVSTLMPYILGFPWALDTIGDLWRMGAPDPAPRAPWQPERRILMPNAFKQWWGEVQTRMGTPLGPEEAAPKTSKQRVLLPKGHNRA